MEEQGKYSTQKKYLSTRKQLRVWVDPEKYDALREKARRSGTSVYALVNGWIERYLQEEPGE